MSSSLRKQRLKYVAIIACGVLAVYFIFSKLFSSSIVSIPYGTPEVIIVTVLEPDLKPEYVTKIKENREEYASRYGEDSEQNF